MPNPSSWRKSAAVFHDRAQDYDQWFENSLVFQSELLALRELHTPFGAPKIEVGVGPGRFAEALGVRFGLDPAWAPLKLAARRNVIPCLAIGENLPIRSGAAGTIFLLFTLCFLAEPRQVLAECHRVLAPAGHLVLGMINVNSAWGRMLDAKGKAGHLFYRHARFHEPAGAEAMLAENGFQCVESRSGLGQPPEQLREPEHSTAGVSDRAGIVLLVGRKEKTEEDFGPQGRLEPVPPLFQKFGGQEGGAADNNSGRGKHADPDL